MTPNIRVIFLIGKKDETNKHSALKMEDSRKLKKEMDEFCDILQGQ